MLYRFKNLSQFSAINHFVSTRNGGVSTGEKASLNLSFKVGDDEKCVLQNRQILANKIGIPASHLIFPEQTHTAHVQIVKEVNLTSVFDNTDALITNLKGVCVSVMSADCVPILLFDKEKNVVAAIHAGWRGTVSGIVGNTISLMKSEFNCDASKIMAAIGPSISADIYDVGAEVIAAVEAIVGTTDGIVTHKANGKGMLNLWEANARLLQKSGVMAQHIEVSGICTYKHYDQFFSHRKSPETGRFAAGIYLL
jgi:YfiH family protein